MTDKFHTIKFWNEKSSRVTKREYISVEAVQDWIDQQSKTEKDLGWMSLLVKLEQFIKDK